MRQAFGWLVNWYAYAHLDFTVIVYAAIYGPEDTTMIIEGWMVSLTMALGVLEPFNIFMVALLPVLFSEESCCMKCYNNVFHVYNEYLA